MWPSWQKQACRIRSWVKVTSRPAGCARAHSCLRLRHTRLPDARYPFILRMWLKFNWNDLFLTKTWIGYHFSDGKSRYLVYTASYYTFKHLLSVLYLSSGVAISSEACGKFLAWGLLVRVQNFRLFLSSRPFVSLATLLNSRYSV